jgi:hypothetical protein
MSTKTIWNQRFGMLMASGSPGSALAYQLGDALSGPSMMRRNITTVGATGTKEQGKAPARPTGSWLGRLFERFEAWSYTREMREIEAYLAQAQNHADLESRMRHLHDDLLSRARALR